MDNVHFRSRNNPVPNFNIKTKQGDLHVKEIFLTDKEFKSEIAGATVFFFKNILDTTQNPAYLKILNLPNKIRTHIFKSSINTQIELLKEGANDSTFLVAKDINGVTKAGCMTMPFTYIRQVKDDKTLYVANVAVDREYRKNNVGIKMVDKIVECSNNRFTDMTLFAENGAIPAYKKAWGLQEFSPKDEKQDLINKKITKSRLDYPKYVAFMHKSLDDTQPRWWDRVSNMIDNLPWWEKLL